MKNELVKQTKLLSYIAEGLRLCIKSWGGFRDWISGNFKSLGIYTSNDTQYLGYAKAFNKVDYKILLVKLHKYWFSSQFIWRIRSFLTDGKQCVVLDGHRSVLASIISGVPQGTVLWPILFILFLNDLQGSIKHSNVSFFADDTHVLKQINSQQDVILLKEDLNNIICWSRSNNMKLHKDKFNFLVNRSKRNDTLHELPFMSDCMSFCVSNGNK